MKKPTIKQELAFNELLNAQKNGETISMKKIMTRAGYSEKSAINPGLNLTNRPGWQALMDAHFDDEAIANEIKSIAFDEGDKRAKLAALDMMLKLKDKYPSTKFKVDAMESEYKPLMIPMQINEPQRDRTTEEN
jgi:hypothetical protein